MKAALAILLCAASCARKPAESCDGSAANCDRRYDQVTYAATHNAFAYASGGPVTYNMPNQDLPIPQQLAYGIRTFGIRPCPAFGIDANPEAIYVTHNYSALGGALGGEPLANILGEIKSFLDANPSEIITLLQEDTVVTPVQVAAVFKQAGLDSYLYPHAASKPWPMRKVTPVSA